MAQRPASRGPRAHDGFRARRRLTAAVLAMALAMTACASDRGDEGALPENSHLVPSFPPEDENGEHEDADTGTDIDEGAESGDEPAGTDSGPEEARPTETEASAEGEDSGREPDARPNPEAPPEPESGATPQGATRSAVSDPRGDTSSPLLGSAPDWADLVAGSVARADDGDVTLVVEFAEPPERPREGTTANVASFHDLTGDGRMDLEIWLNFSEQGWFPSWRDNREGEAAFGEDADLAIDVDGSRLEVLVPAERFGQARSWRWSLGLEWGRYEWLGTSAAAHDLAPDEGFVEHGV